MGLVGRDHELEVVARAVEDVRGGGSQVLGVLGEAGIGKSAVLAAIAERAERAGMLVLRSRGVEHEREVPFGVVIDTFDGRVAALPPADLERLGADLSAVLPAVAEHSGEWAASTAGPVERFRYNRALRALVEQLGRERPVALVLDDLQWADEASIELVLHLLRRRPAVAHLVAFATRPGGAAPRLLDAARGPDSAQLTLEPLGHEASLGLLACVDDPELREQVAREARGNPFFLGELARVAGRASETLPSTVLASVGLEVAALAPTARALIDGAAVAGDPFDPDLAAAAAGAALDAGALDGLVASDLVRANESPRAFAFRHPLIRRAVYDLAPPAWRVAAHERVAAALAVRGATAAVRACHVERFARPGDEAAIALLCEAADECTNVSPSAAAHWFAAALALVPEIDAQRRTALLTALALALAGAGRLHDSRAALIEAHALVPREHAAHRLELVAGCARVETALGRYADARRRLLAAVAHAPTESNAALRFELAANAFSEGRFNELQQRAARAAEAAREPLMLAAAEALGSHGARWNGDAHRAQILLDRATARVNATEDDALAARPALCIYVAIPQLLAERFPDAATTSERALDVSRRTGNSQALVPLLTTQAWARLQLMELDAALSAAEAAEEIARLQAVPRLIHFALWIRAVVLHEHGEHTAAEHAADECATIVRGLEPSNTTRIGTCNLVALRADHDPAGAVREIVATAGPDLEAAEPSAHSWLLLRLVRAAIATGALREAETWARRAHSQNAHLQLPAGAVRATVARAEVHLARGDATRAAALAEEAAAAAQLVPAPLDAAGAHLVAARAHAALGDTAQAKATLEKVAADADRGGAHHLRDTAGHELRRLGFRRPGQSRHSNAAHREPLTSREHEIATLVSQGHPNKQIAATLYLSEKTVANTLTRVYAKLGVRSRTQLARTHTTNS